MSLETALGIADDGRPLHEWGSQIRPVTWPAGGSPFLHRRGDRCPADRRAKAASDPAYIKTLNGTLGLDPSLCQ